MSCERFEPLLNRLSDGDLNPLVAAVVRNHVARCRHCAALYADIERINLSIASWRDALMAGHAPASLFDGVRRRIAENPSPVAPASDVLGPVISPDDTRSTQRGGPPPSVVARRRQRVMRPVTVAIAFACALALSIRLLPTRPAVAFPQVLQAVERIAFTHMRLSMQRVVNSDAHGMIVYDAYLRTDPPAFAMTLPGGLRLVGGRTGVRMITGHGAPPIAVTDVPLTRDDIRKAMLSPDELLHGKLGESPAQWGPAESVTAANGTPEIRFRSNVARMRRSLWVDPLTFRPLRLELFPEPSSEPTPSSGQPQSSAPYVMTIQFSYAETPPPGTFDVPADPSPVGAARPSRHSGK